MREPQTRVTNASIKNCRSIFDVSRRRMERAQTEAPAKITSHIKGLFSCTLSETGAGFSVDITMGLPAGHLGSGSNIAQRVLILVRLKNEGRGYTRLTEYLIRPSQAIFFLSEMQAQS